MGQGLRARRRDRTPGEGGHRHGGIVDEPIDGHLARFPVNRRTGGGQPGEFPGQLLLFGHAVFRTVHAHFMHRHRPLLYAQNGLSNGSRYHE